MSFTRKRSVSSQSPRIVEYKHIISTDTNYYKHGGHVEKSEVNVSKAISVYEISYKVAGNDAV